MIKLFFCRQNTFGKANLLPFAFRAFLLPVFQVIFRCRNVTFYAKGQAYGGKFLLACMFLQISQEKLFKHPFGDAVCKRQTFCLFTDCKVFYFSKCISFACKGGFSLCGVSKLNVTCKLPPTRGFPCFLLPFHGKILLTFLPKRFPENSGVTVNEIQPFRKQHFKGNHINSQSNTLDMPKIYPNHIA